MTRGGIQCRPSPLSVLCYTDGSQRLQTPDPALLQRFYQRSLRGIYRILRGIAYIFRQNLTKRMHLNAQSRTVQEHLAGVVDMRMYAGLAPVGDLGLVAYAEDLSGLIGPSITPCSASNCLMFSLIRTRTWLFTERPS